MTVIGSLRNLIPFSQPTKSWGSEFVRAQVERTLSDSPIIDAINARQFARPRVWRKPTVTAALGVPSIQRAVSLIASTTGMLSVQAYRNGELMTDPPRLVVRPDPDLTPASFYGTAAANMAKWGEIVWWIASRDNDGLASALINVPLRELDVQSNSRDRRRPRYIWGDKEGTRFSPANPTGDFVHIFYPLTEPYALRGEGPLQLCGAAISIAVESQAWAANFYGLGGRAREIVKYAGELDPTPKDEMGLVDLVNGLSEADRFKIQYAARDNNTPIIVDSRVEDIKSQPIDQAGAQMLDARQHQTGDAARMYGIPGSLLEYQQSGSSLTYQNLEGEFTKFVRGCLQPLYLEPIEQAMSDLLTRSMVTRFNIKGFLRADIKTRYEVHELAIKNGIYDPEFAQREEGIIAGDVEFAPVPAAQPASVPTQIPVGSVPSLVASLAVRCPSCNKLVAKALGPGSEIECGRCKTLVRGPEPQVVHEERKAPEFHLHMPENMVRVEAPITVQPSNVTVEPAQVTLNAPPLPDLHITMPDTETRIAGLGTAMESLTGTVETLLERQSEQDERLADVAAANREVAVKLGETLKPRKIVPIREKGQIVSMTSEVA